MCIRDSADAGMSKAVEGVSRWQQRKAAKAQMYATSTEAQNNSGIAARRVLATDAKYTPRTGAAWKGNAWGLASTQVQGRQSAKDTRFSSGSRNGELWYGQKRQLNTELPPDDARNFLARGTGAGKKVSAELERLKKEAAEAKQKRRDAKAERERRKAEELSLIHISEPTRPY